MDRERALRHFWADIDRSGDCWPWLGCFGRNGYGVCKFQGKRWTVHRLTYELLVGPIPAGLQLDHLCRNRACCNPAHLEPVTGHENILRGNGWAGKHARKTHCKHGHPFDEANTYWRKNGGRDCRICRNHRVKRLQARQKASLLSAKDAALD